MELHTPWKISEVLSNEVNTYIQDSRGHIIFGSVGEKRREVAEYIVQTINTLHGKSLPPVKAPMEYFEELEQKVVSILKGASRPLEYYDIQQRLPLETSDLHIKAILARLVSRGSATLAFGKFSWK